MTIAFLPILQKKKNAVAWPVNLTEDVKMQDI